jgi:TM2 domain-containing membrane protein YozV
VVRALQKEPERRYQHVGELKTDVDTITSAPGSKPGQLPAPVPPPPVAPAPTEKRILPAFILAFLFGVFGAHRFYVGKIGTGFFQLFTFGGLGIWATIDWILILCRAFTDKQGRRIDKW